jgi:hypothetical protein
MNTLTNAHELDMNGPRPVQPVAGPWGVLTLL